MVLHEPDARHAVRLVLGVVVGVAVGVGVTAGGGVVRWRAAGVGLTVWTGAEVLLRAGAGTSLMIVVLHPCSSSAAKAMRAWPRPAATAVGRSCAASWRWAIFSIRLCSQGRRFLQVTAARRVLARCGKGRANQTTGRPAGGQARRRPAHVGWPGISRPARQSHAIGPTFPQANRWWQKSASANLVSLVIPWWSWR
jgi:hypothetical protein